MKQAYQSIFIVFSLFIIGCSSIGHHYIKIKAPPFGAEYIPEQITSLLEKTGFNQVRFSTSVVDPRGEGVDPLDTKTGTMVQTSNKLLMHYQHKALASLRVKVTVGKDKGDLKLDFFETGKNKLSLEAMKIYNAFKENLASILYDKNAFTES